MTKALTKLWTALLGMASSASCFVLLVGSVCAAESAPPSRSDLDQRLLEELSQELPARDGSSQQPSAGGPAGANDSRAAGERATSGEPVPEPSKASELGGLLLEGGEDIGMSQEDPLQRIARQMQQVQQRIEGEDLSPSTRKLQQAILDDLDALIQQCQKAQCKPSTAGTKPAQSASMQPGQQAANDSSTELQDRQAELAQQEGVVPAAKEAWGHLPARMRDAMLQTGADQFLPKYQQLIEEYFRGLAEQPSRP